jgi:hypothetical protein
LQQINCIDDVQGLESVSNGSIDYYAMNSYIAERFFNLGNYGDLVILPISILQKQNVFAGSENCSKELLSILNKAIASVPQTVIDGIIVKNTSSFYGIGKSSWQLNWIFLIVLLIVIILVLSIALFSIKRTLELRYKENASILESSALYLFSMRKEIARSVYSIMDYCNELDDEPQHRALEGQYIRAVLDNALVFDKFDSELKSEIYTRYDFICNLNMLFRPLCREKKLDFSIDLDAVPSCFKTDIKRFNQIFINLMILSVKFSGEGGSISISSELISPESSTKTVRILIKGSGFASKDPMQDYSMDDYFDFEEFSLDLSRRLLALMDSKLYASAVPETGTTFTVDFNFRQV